jgi:predicted nucleic-acid-binding protein
VEIEQEVFTAMIALKEGHCSFVDALIGGLGARAGGTCTPTFDRWVARLAGFEVVS